MLAAKYGDNFLDKPEDDWLSTIRSEAIAIMGGIEEDLANLGISMDRFSSGALVDSGAVQIAIERLQAAGTSTMVCCNHLKAKSQKTGSPENNYCSKPRLLVMIPTGRCKSDGSWTYFATDVAYHWKAGTHQRQADKYFWGRSRGVR